MFAMSRQLKGALMAAGGGVCWGISGTMGQYLFTHETMQTTWLIPIRLGLAGLILFVYWLVKDRRLLFAPWRQRGSTVMLVLYGIFGISLSQFLYFLTIQFSNAAIGTIMQDLSPVMVLLVACAGAHRKPRAYEIASIVLALLGVTLLTTHGDLTAFAVSPVALIAGVACAVCVTVYNCLCPRRELRDYPVSMLQAWAFLMGAVLFELTMHPWTLGYTPSLRGVGGILFVVLIRQPAGLQPLHDGREAHRPGKERALRLCRAGHGGHSGRDAAQYAVHGLGRAGLCRRVCHAGGAVCRRKEICRAAGSVNFKRKTEQIRGDVSAPFLFMRDGHSSHNGCPTRCTPQHRMYLRSTGSLFHKKLAVSTKNCCLFTLFCHKKC